jgi:hypothetical protein
MEKKGKFLNEKKSPKKQKFLKLVLFNLPEKIENKRL